jgi:hypothetical protein
MAEQENETLDEFRKQWKREINENQSQKEESEVENTAANIFSQAVDLERKSLNTLFNIIHTQISSL